MVLSSMLARLEIEIKATHTIGEKEKSATPDDYWEHARTLGAVSLSLLDLWDRTQFAVVLAKMLLKWPLKVFSKVFSEMTQDDMGNLIGSLENIFAAWKWKMAWNFHRRWEFYFTLCIELCHVNRICSVHT